MSGTLIDIAGAPRCGESGYVQNVKWMISLDHRVLKNSRVTIRGKKDDPEGCQK